jgi:predicted O-methyltransferase YrrM
VAKRWYSQAFSGKTGKKVFRGFQKAGIHVLPNHYYSPIPDTRTLDDSIWQPKDVVAGVDLRLPEQLELLKSLQDYKSEYDAFPKEQTTDQTQFHLRNGSYESVDAEVLYALLRHLKPQRVIEIGSGNTTLLAAQALRKNAAEGSKGSITAIEPYPTPMLRNDIAEVVELIEEPVQNVPVERFEALGEGDVLFIDSSHVLKIGSDVWYEFLEILPRLKKGVWVHVHDIFFPEEYPKEWVLDEHRFWNEQYLLQAFLAFNSAYQVRWSGRAMTLSHPTKVAAAIGSFDQSVRPGGFWMQRVG